jgi:hypothetical protein
VLGLLLKATTAEIFCPFCCGGMYFYITHIEGFMKLLFWFLEVFVNIFAFVFWFTVERRDYFSGLLTNAGLVFLATMVLGSDGYSQLGVVLTGVSLFFGFIFSKGDGKWK